MTEKTHTQLLTLFLLVLVVAVWLTPRATLSERQAAAPAAPTSSPATPAATNNPVWHAALHAAVATDSAFTPGAHPALLLKFVSTGTFYEMPLTETVTATVVHAYTTNAAGTLLEVPVAVAVSTSDAHYSLFWPKLGAPVSAETLRRAQQNLPRGRLFSATLFDFVAATQVEWAACAQFQYPGEPLCTLAAAYQAQYPGVEGRLLARTLAEGPDGWVLLGWGLTPFTPDNASQWELSLP